jgi:hypothetical protein
MNGLCFSFLPFLLLIISCLFVCYSLSSPCQNGGSCIDRAGKYNCICTNGYTGSNCQTRSCSRQYYSYSPAASETALSVVNNMAVIWGSYQNNAAVLFDGNSTETVLYATGSEHPNFLQSASDYTLAAVSPSETYSLEMYDSRTEVCSLLFGVFARVFSLKLSVSSDVDHHKSQLPSS